MTGDRLLPAGTPCRAGSLVFDVLHSEDCYASMCDAALCEPTSAMSKAWLRQEVPQSWEAQRTSGRWAAEALAPNESARMVRVFARSKRLPVRVCWRAGARAAAAVVGFAADGAEEKRWSGLLMFPFIGTAGQVSGWQCRWPKRSGFTNAAIARCGTGDQCWGRHLPPRGSPDGPVVTVLCEGLTDWLALHAALDFVDLSNAAMRIWPLGALSAGDMSAAARIAANDLEGIDAACIAVGDADDEGEGSAGADKAAGAATAAGLPAWHMTTGSGDLRDLLQGSDSDRAVSALLANAKTAAEHSVRVARPRQSPAGRDEDLERLRVTAACRSGPRRKGRWEPTMDEAVTAVQAVGSIHHAAQSSPAEWHGSCPQCGTGTGSDRLWVSKDGAIHCRHCDAKGVWAAARDWQQERSA